MTTIPKKYQNLLEDFPFLTLVAYGGNEYVGIVQNVDHQLAKSTKLILLFWSLLSPKVLPCISV